MHLTELVSAPHLICFLPCFIASSTNQDNIAVFARKFGSPTKKEIGYVH